MFVEVVVSAHEIQEAKMITALVFSAAKTSFKSVVSIFCCNVSVGNIILHFQTFSKREITDFNPFLAAENSVLIILACILYA